MQVLVDLVFVNRRFGGQLKTILYAAFTACQILLHRFNGESPQAYARASTIVLSERRPR